MISKKRIKIRVIWRRQLCKVSKLMKPNASKPNLHGTKQCCLLSLPFSCTEGDALRKLLSFAFNFLVNSSVIGERANLKMNVSRKQSLSNFPKNEYFLPPHAHMYVCVSGGKKCFEAPVLRFAFLPYYRWNNIEKKLGEHTPENYDLLHWCQCIL